MSSADQLGTYERDVAEFFHTAARNLRKCLQRDPAIRADEIDAAVNRLPQLLREPARFLARCETDDL